jgi:hypothetical protein
MWTWEDRLQASERETEWIQSRDYTSVILKDTSRRIMQKIHAVEKLECFEVLVEKIEKTEVCYAQTLLTIGPSDIICRLRPSQNP